MSSCSVSTDRYWNFIATPLLFSVVGFGTYVLLTAGEEFLTDKRNQRTTTTTTTTRVTPAASAAAAAAAPLPTAPRRGPPYGPP